MGEELEAGSRQMIRAIAIDGPAVPGCDRAWPITVDGLAAGQVTSTTWSPDFNTNVAIGMVAREFWEAGTELVVAAPDEARRAVVQDGFWI